jgi:hypothetical protein
MKNLWKGAAALVMFGVACLPMASSGCVDAEASFFIRGVKFQGCEALSADGPDVAVGTMDIRYSCNYFAVLELGNQLVRRGDETKLQIETSRINVERVDVEVLGADGETGIGAFTYPTTGFVDPSSAGNPGRGLAGALLVDGGTSAKIAEVGGGLFIARIVAHGRTLGGDDISTRPFDFPLEICIGCLCFEPANDTCIESEGAPAEQCFFPQDVPFDCRWLSGHTCSEPATCGIFQ